CENLGDGKDPWPAAQLEAIEQTSAALCRAHGWTAASVIRHLDWQPGKVDPRGIDWTAMRDRIAKRLKGKPGSGSTTTTYTVGKGDTLWSIAASKLGDGNRYKEIAKLNGLRDADAITPGQELTIPKK
ncbi:MAG: LysM peptidoglycan-binding domain-containing protein, partial [Streptomyces sp.]|nr:LysM peptidoglycan-binding domain-containing protein [Streptomyces sp.]